MIAKINYPSQKEIQSDSQIKSTPQNIRRRAIDAICEMKIIDPRIKDHKEKSALLNPSIVLKSL